MRQSSVECLVYPYVFFALLTRFSIVLLLSAPLAGQGHKRAGSLKGLAVASEKKGVQEQPPGSQAAKTGTEAQPPRRDLSNLPALLAKAAQQGRIRVIVRLDSPFVPEGLLSSAESLAQRASIASVQDALLTKLAEQNATLAARFRFIPYLALELDGTALSFLADLPEVIELKEDLAVPPTLASSIPVIGADIAWANGYTGSGQTVAVLDTGVDSSHSFFTTGGSKILSEACYSSTTSISSSVCPGGVSESTAPGSGVNCPLSVVGCNHGTHVAGIAAGNNGGANIGVARDGTIIAIQVFSRFNFSSNCSPLPAPCALTFFSDLIKGLERVFALRNSFDIAAANMSLGGGQFFDEASCDANNSSIKSAIDNLRSVGIASVISAGNDAFRNSLGAPGCISTAISVGATDDFDNVASFSNIASFLKLLAPGVSVTSSVPGGGTAIFNGTSMSAPHVTGSWAVLKQINPNASVAQILGALASTGTPVDDNRSGGTVDDIPRINLDLAAALVSGSLLLGDDDFVEVNLPFSFPFCGTDYSSVYVGSNGYLTFGSGDGTFTESIPNFLAGAPRIAALWDDLDPSSGGTVRAEQFGPFFKVTYTNVPEFPDIGSNSFEIVLRPSGTFAINYGSLSASDGLAGLSPGNGAQNPGEINLTAAPQPIGGALDEAVYEVFASGDNDLANLGFEFSACPGVGSCIPPAAGNWVVSQDCILVQSTSAPADVIVNPNVTLTIAAGVNLDIDSPSHRLHVLTGAKVVVNPGGKVE